MWDELLISHAFIFPHHWLTNGPGHLAQTKKGDYQFIFRRLPLNGVKIARKWFPCFLYHSYHIASHCWMLSQLTCPCDNPRLLHLLVPWNIPSMSQAGEKADNIYALSTGLPSHTASTTWLTTSPQSGNDIYLEKGVRMESTFTNDGLKERAYLRSCSSYEEL